MRTYEKIETVFNRDTVGTKKLILGGFAMRPSSSYKITSGSSLRKWMERTCVFAGTVIG